MNESEDDYSARARRRNSLIMDRSFYEKNRFNDGDAHGRLADMVSDFDVPEKYVDFLLSLIAAIDGRNHCVRIEIFDVPEGQTPRLAGAIEKIVRWREIADIIDKSVATGTKQEAAIADISARYGMSRREVFRALKHQRQRRKEMREMDLEDDPNSDIDFEPRYPGFTIADDGTLVPEFLEK